MVNMLVCVNVLLLGWSSVTVGQVWPLPGSNLKRKKCLDYTAEPKKGKMQNGAWTFRPPKHTPQFAFWALHLRSIDRKLPVCSLAMLHDTVFGCSTTISFWCSHKRQNPFDELILWCETKRGDFWVLLTKSDMRLVSVAMWYEKQHSVARARRVHAHGRSGHTSSLYSHQFLTNVSLEWVSAGCSDLFSTDWTDRYYSALN